MFFTIKKATFWVLQPEPGYRKTGLGGTGFKYILYVPWQIRKICFGNVRPQSGTNYSGIFAIHFFKAIPNINSLQTDYSANFPKIHRIAYGYMIFFNSK